MIGRLKRRKPYPPIFSMIAASTTEPPVGGDRWQDAIFTAAEAAVMPEIALAKVSLDRVKRRNPANSDHKMTRKELAALAPHAEGGRQRGAPRGRTDRAVQPRCAQSVEEAAVHGGAVERAQRASVGVREDGLGAELGCDASELSRDFVEGFVPGNPLEIARIAGIIVT